MKLSKVILAALLITGIAGAQAHVDPSTHAMRTYDIPIGADYGLTLHTDTLHATTDEKGWPLNANTVKVVIVNPNDAFMLWRFDTDASPLAFYLGNYGTDTIVAPGMVATSPMDSIFVDAEVAGTLYIRWWSFD